MKERRDRSLSEVRLNLQPSRRAKEYNWKVKAGSGLVILSLGTTSCVADIRRSPSATINPTAPRATETLSPTNTPEPKTWPGISYQRNDVLAYGSSSGAGGVGRTEAQVFMNARLENSFVNKGLRPVVDSRNGNLFTQVLNQGGLRTCFPNVPELLYDPDVPSQQDDFIKDVNNVRYYGDLSNQEIRYQAVVPVTLNPILSEDIVCGSAVAMFGKSNMFNAKAGTLLNVLYNKKTGEIYGGFRSVFAPDENVVLDSRTSKITANGKNVWYEGPGIAKLLKEVEDKPVFNRESLSCLSRQECLSGQIEIGPGAAAFYKDIWASLLQSGVNDEYFARNFGITNPNDINGLISAMRRKGYNMPAGLTIVHKGRQPMLVELTQMPSFKSDSLLVQILDSDTFISRRLNGEIKSNDFFDTDGNATLLWGLNLVKMDDRSTRLSLLVATTTSIPWGPAGVNPSDSSSISKLNHFYEFIPFLFRNMKNARFFREQYYMMDVSNYFFHREYEWNKIEGNYAWNGKSSLQIFKFSGR